MQLLVGTDLVALRSHAQTRRSLGIRSFSSWVCWTHTHGRRVAVYLAAVGIDLDRCALTLAPPSDSLALALAVALTRATRSLARPDLAVVLVEPKIPQNSGNVSRSCAATKVALHLVAPAFELDDKKLKRAGLDYWDWVCLKPHASIEDFLEFYAGIEGEKRLIAFSKFGSTHHASEGLYRSRTADGRPVRNFLLFGT